MQKTLLGTFRVRGKKKIVVACRDFTSPGAILQDFASLKNQMIDSERNTAEPLGRTGVPAAVLRRGSICIELYADTLQPLIETLIGGLAHA